MFGWAIDIADKLGILRALKSRLVKAPDPAAEKLAAVLEEISKVFESLNSELVRYLSLTFDDNNVASPDLEVLNELAGGGSEIRVMEARPHCSKINNIYQKYLSPWFASVLQPEEADLLRSVFSDLSLQDDALLLRGQELADWLSAEAATTLAMIQAGDTDGANRRLAKARLDTIPVRRSASSALIGLRELEAEFIEASGAV